VEKIIYFFLKKGKRYIIIPERAIKTRIIEKKGLKLL